MNTDITQAYHAQPDRNREFAHLENGEWETAVNISGSNVPNVITPTAVHDTGNEDIATISITRVS